MYCPEYLEIYIGTIESIKLYNKVYSSIINQKSFKQSNACGVVVT